MAAGFYFEGAGSRAALDAIFEGADGEPSVVCLMGPAGIGRTTTIQRFLREADPEIYAVAHVAGDILMSAEQCCAALNARLDHTSEDGDACAALRGSLIRVRASGRKPVILLDDADELGEEALIALLDVCRDGRALLVLAGGPSLARQPVVASASALVVAIRPLAEAECAVFASAWEQHQRSGRSPSGREASRLWRKCEGNPGTLIALLERRAPASASDFWPGNVPVGHVLFIVAALIALAWLLSDMVSNRSRTTAAMTEVPITLPGASAALPDAPAEAFGGVTVAAVPRPVVVAPRPASPARVVDIPDEGALLSPVPVAAPAPVPESLKEPRLVDGRYSVEEQALQAEKPSRYTLQFFASFNEGSVRQFVTRHAGGGMRSFRSVREGLPWYVAVSGSYRTRDDARNAVGGLPLAWQELKPWPRSFQGIQDELRRRPD